jgi:hypothetical protein
MERFTLPFFGPKASTITVMSRDIERYAENRRQSVKGTTTNKELACIRHKLPNLEFADIGFGAPDSSSP